ncbi:hypothetical protein [Paraherbaspirillum soli]|uniref:Dinitrogenase iron-molybdenum cofactor biosynthesis domain-containing protein n=1 Tax=Paraherbaspirillum soli TaxID=631222 RepID=A0ABW0ME13_9BURK
MLQNKKGAAVAPFFVSHGFTEYILIDGVEKSIVELATNCGGFGKAAPIKLGE